MKKKLKLGIALSGGGAKGFAHLGVLKALEEYDLKPDIISGVSAGAIMGVLYADGKSVEEIMDFFKKASFFNFAMPTLPKLGIMNPIKFEKQLRGFLHATTFEELQIPLVVNATDLCSGKNAIFRSGEHLVDAVIGSSSVPIFFTPHIIEGKQYVDGGIFCNMPASSIRSECEILIGVHVNPICVQSPAESVWEVAERTFHFSIQSSTISEKELCDLVIDVKDVKKYGMFDMGKNDEIFDCGYKVAKKLLKNLVME